MARRRRSARRDPGVDLLTILDELQPWRLTLLGPEVWPWLWLGTMRLLARQEPRAFVRVLTKLERDGIIGFEPDIGAPADEVARAVREGRDPDVELVATEALRFLGGSRPDEANADRVRIMEYGKDARPVLLRGKGRRLLHPPPRTVLVYAYYGARWKLTRESGPRLRGDTLQDRAIALVAHRYSLTVESARTTILRARTALPVALRRKLRTGAGGGTFWRATMTGPRRSHVGRLLHAFASPEKPALKR